MIKLVVTNEKNLELTELEKVHVGENKFGYYLIFLPENLNGYNLTDCEVKLIQVFEDDTSVAIDVDTTQETRPIKEFITLDATSQAQMVTLSVLITHNGNIIGKTNQKTFQVCPTKNATPIDPREDLDEIIAELRADKAELETTVSEQAAEITEQTARITELSNQVENLTEENTEQAETIERQETTIDQLNSRVPKMYTPPIVTPSGSVQQITPPPDEDYDGLTECTVDRVTAAVDDDIIPENIKEGVDILGVEGTYKALGGEGGIYINEVDEDGYPVDIVVENWDGHCNVDLSVQNESNAVAFELPIGYNKDIYSTRIKNLEFKNCKNLCGIYALFQNRPYGEIFKFSGENSGIRQNMFVNCTNLKKVILDCTYLGNGCFRGCPNLEEVYLYNIKNVSDYALRDNIKLKTLHIPNSITTDLASKSLLTYNAAMENVTLENGFNANGLNLSSSTLYSHDTILSWFNALADRTGQTAYTLTIGTTNLNKMTAEEKAIAINKNWNLA